MFKIRQDELEQNIRQAEQAKLQQETEIIMGVYNYKNP